MLRIHKNLEERNSSITQKKSIKSQKEKQEEERKKELQNQPESKNWSGNKHVLIITLNVNRLSALSKRHRMADWITKQEPTTNHKCWKGYGEKGTLVEMQIFATTMENSMRFLKKTKNRVTIWSCNPTPGHKSGKDENFNLKRYIHPNVHSCTIYNSQDMEAS